MADLFAILASKRRYPRLFFISKLPMHIRNLLRMRSVLSALTLVCVSTMASGQSLLDAGTIKITPRDIQRELERIPAEARTNIASKSETLSQFTLNHYLRLALANEFLASKEAKSAEAADVLANARMRTLADLELARLDRQNRLNVADAEQRAHALYKAELERFQTGESVQTRHILFGFGTDRESARRKAEDTRKRILGGEDFAKLAAELSEDPGTKGKGGDLGIFERGRMAKPFEDAAFALTKEVPLSEIVESQFGYHLIQLIDKKPAGTKPFDEVKASLLEEVQTKAIREGRVAAAQRLTDKAKINKDAVDAMVKDFKTVESKEK